MSILLLVVTDGRRECIAQTIPSALANLTGPISHKVIYDDSADRAYGDWLQGTFPGFDIVQSATRQGFGGAISAAWNYITLRPEQYVMHVEDDFLFNRPVNLVAMAGVLDLNSNVVQVALRRQPWNDAEKAVGGVVEQHPQDYEDRLVWGLHHTSWGAPDPRMHHVLLHRRFFTTNPSLYRMDLCRRGWPSVRHSEGMFTHQVLEDPDARFAYWGRRTDAPWVHHIGDQRAGVGY